MLSLYGNGGAFERLAQWLWHEGVDLAQPAYGVVARRNQILHICVAKETVTAGRIHLALSGRRAVIQQFCDARQRFCQARMNVKPEDTCHHDHRNGKYDGEHVGNVDTWCQHRTLGADTDEGHNYPA
jgi:hypothetical protein